MMTTLRLAFHILKKTFTAAQNQVAARFYGKDLRNQMPEAHAVYVKHVHPDSPVGDASPPHRLPVDFENNGAARHVPTRENPAFQELSSWNTDEMTRFSKEGQVSQETLEGWMSAGLLYPEEMRAADKLVKSMRRRNA